MTNYPIFMTGICGSFLKTGIMGYLFFIWFLVLFFSTQFYVLETNF